MGLMNTLFGNASEISTEQIEREYGPLLCDGELIEKAFKLFRDKWVFTNKRLIVQNTQGATGKKREYMSVPYRSIERFSVETAGTFDMDSDLKLWIKKADEPLQQKIGKDADILEVQRLLAKYVL